jgi:hypothetical protein
LIEKECEDLIKKSKILGGKYKLKMASQENEGNIKNAYVTFRSMEGAARFLSAY